MEFEWDEEKRLVNIDKHGVDFLDVCRLFEEPYLMFQDKRRDYGEVRSLAIGHVSARLMVIVFTKRQETIRIISARKANEREKEKFANKIKEQMEKNRCHEG